jgi:multidrug resistance protein, MATE family
VAGCGAALSSARPMSTSFNTEMRALFTLALPLAASQAGSQLMGLVDVAVVGRLGAHELAAVGVGNAVFFALSVFGMGIVLGVDPLVSQAVGAGDRLRARRALWQGVWLTGVVTAVLTLLMCAAAVALPLLGTPDLIHGARTFLLIRMVGLAPFLLYFVIRSYLQAHGITRPLVVSMLVANVANLAIDMLLVFGGEHLPAWTGPLRFVPPMGIAGAALSTLICSFVQLAIIASAVKHVEVEGFVDHRWDRAEVGKAFRVGLPIGLHMGAEVGVFALVALLAARLGTLHLAAHQLVITLASFTFTVAVGVATAGSVRVGLAIGSRDEQATRIAGHAAFVAGALVMGCSAAAFALAPRAIARLVTDQENVIAFAIPLLIVAAVFQLSDGVQAVGAGVLRGAGDTTYAFYANIVGHWLVGFPTALYLGFHMKMGVVGLWWGLCVGLTVVAIILFVRFEKLSAGTIAPIVET